MIKPTVGKRVWFWPVLAPMEGAVYNLGNQPLAAFITYVHSDTSVNLAFFDRNSNPDRATQIPLWQTSYPRPPGYFCEFHPDDLPIIESRPKLTLSKKVGS